MLKKKNQPQTVSSIFLWQEICENTYANKPWQKLMNHILLILQILAILLVVLALMAPKIPWGAHYYKNVIFVVDTSASMHARYEETTRLEVGKDWMRHYINQAGEETKGYIITVGNQATLALAGSSHKEALLGAIDHIKPSYSVSKLEEGLQMAKALGESLQEAYEIVVLTDEAQQGEKSVHYVYLGKAGNNGAITRMSHQVTEEKAIVLLQVMNKGNQLYEADASLYGEEALLDVQEVKLGPGESITLHFELPLSDGGDLGYGYLKGELSAKDDLAEDNTYYYVDNEAKGRRILLVTKGNMFLEKALMSLKDCEVYKTTDPEVLEGNEKYDLYVLDNQKDLKLPKSGNMLLVNSTPSVGLEETALDTTTQVEAVKANLPDYLQSLNFVVSQCVSYKVPYWGRSLLKAGASTIGLIGEKEGQKIGILGFDLWNSDFVLKTEFPLLIEYLVDELLDTAIVNKYTYTSDETMELHQSSIEAKVAVQMPSGANRNIENNRLTPNQELGLYHIHLSLDKLQSTLIAVNYPVQLESDLSQEVVGEQKALDEIEGLKGEKNIAPYLILLLLGIVLVEWYFYRKGY